MPIGAASQIVIPAAGDTDGANGTFFRSDVTIVNFAAHDQVVSLQWLPQAGSGGTTVTKSITISASSGIRSADFVHDYLNVSGLGSLLVSGLTSAGTIDTTAALYAASRIWTTQPATTGTTSQSFDAVPLNAINTSSAALFSMGSITNPTGFRVNVGIVNVDATNAQTFSIQVPSLPGPPPSPAIIVTIPAMSMQQVSVGAGPAFGVPEITVENITPTTTKSNLWIAYSSTIDNTTGDAWSELAVPGAKAP